MSKFEEPTAQQCTENAEVSPGVFACWYPQMGGYGAFCLVDVSGGKPGDCFDVYVWHDGEFPFGGEKPVDLHHCMPEQFIKFGKLVLEMQGKVSGNDTPV